MHGFLTNWDAVILYGNDNNLNW